MRVELFQTKDQEEHIDIHYQELTPLVESVVSLVEYSETKNLLSCKNEKGEKVVIKPEEVLYFESVDKRSFAYLREAVYQIQENLVDLANNLASQGFVRINKSYVINIYHVKSIKPELNMRVRAYMENGEFLIINRSYKKGFESFLKERRNMI